MAKRKAQPRGVSGTSRVEVFLRRLTVAMVLFFGLGTLFSNGAMLFLVTPEGRAHVGPIPLPLLWFDCLAGAAYVVAAWGIGYRRAWAAQLAWGLAVAHALSASAVWLWYLGGHPVAKATLGLVLAREGFWVLIGLYLSRDAEPPGGARS